MIRRRSTSEEEGTKVPGYIVTFSDMVTLLLTFFVLLLTLADVKDPELFDKGRDSFIESLRHVGLGMLFGRSDPSHFGKLKIKYSTDNPDEPTDSRTIDASAEEIRRIRNQLKQRTKIVPSPIIAETTSFSVTNVHFSPGRDDLNEAARKFLTGYCRDLQQETGRKQVILYVLGLASEGSSEKERWLLSARRANIVADFLRDILSSSSESGIQRPGGTFERQSKYSIYSWGAGPGDGWADRDSPFSKQSQILIAVLRRND
ncbi:flagellar motor protein MotB [Planctomycetota bacterium]